MSRSKVAKLSTAEASAAVDAPGPASTPAPAEDRHAFDRIVSIATLVLVIGVAIVSLFYTATLYRFANAAVASETRDNETLSALAASANETRRSLARIEQRLAAPPPAAAHSEVVDPPDASSVPRREAARLGNCVRVYRSGLGTRVECGH